MYLVPHDYPQYIIPKCIDGMMHVHKIIIMTDTGSISFVQLTVNLIVFFFLLKVTDTFALKLESSTDADEVSLKHSLSTTGAARVEVSLMASMTAIFGQHGSTTSDKLVFKVSPLSFVYAQEHDT